jgi:predicted DNA-binding transcriptional regulator AlpA
MKRLTSHTAVASASSLPSPVAATIPRALAEFPYMPDAGYIRLPVVASLFACSPATVWRRVKNGTLPVPRKLSEGVTAWNVGQIRQALKGEVWE